MVNQLKMAIIQSILTLHERGWAGRRIADTLDVDCWMVTRYLELAKQANQPASEALS